LLRAGIIDGPIIVNFDIEMNLPICFGFRVSVGIAAEDQPGVAPVASAGAGSAG